jgi:hypothetical protein
MLVITIGIVANTLAGLMTFFSIMATSLHIEVIFFIGQIITRRVHNPLFEVFLFFRLLFLLFGF